MAEGPLVAVILGAAVWESGPSPTLRRRAEQALALWQAGRVDHLLPCGGLGRHPPAEARAMATLFRAGGVPEAAITCEARSTTTAENLRFAAALLETLKPREVYLVTDGYHMPRARLIARRLGIATKAAPVPRAGAHWPTLVKGTLREVPAYLAYLTGLRRP